MKLVIWCCGAATVASLAALKFLPAPYIWLSLSWIAAGAVIVARGRAVPLRMTALLASVLMLALGAVESVLWIAGLPREPVSREYTPRPYVNDSVLGWRLVPGQATRATARLRDSLIYDVTYTVDSLGYRVTPGATPTSSCALFVACSFTFGEGVQDWETLPYRVGEHTKGRVHAINGGVPAYGIEHVVAALEQKTRGPVLPCAPTHIIYQALPHHVVRAAHVVKFSRHGPRYELTGEGSLAYQGTSPPPETQASGVWANAQWQLSKARLYRLLQDQQTPPGSLADLRLYLALVRRARDLFAERYPQAEFHILAWSIGGFYTKTFQVFHDSLARLTPAVHDVDNILPGYSTTPLPYQIHQRDPHPNALAYDLLARFVVDSILTAR